MSKLIASLVCGFASLAFTTNVSAATLIGHWRSEERRTHLVHGASRWGSGMGGVR